ncbi:TolC family protein [Zhaonella formicivorans]|uniref:TolC family protein n=1 Tax=Zhaonella formicivorans TaxID=2528593 RepID=UPI0010D53828|nr:TolC family protein [Zhaonella formicivorans]
MNKHKLLTLVVLGSFLANLLPWGYIPAGAGTEEAAKTVGQEVYSQKTNNVNLNGGNGTKEANVKQLTLDEAIDYALKHSLDMRQIYLTLREKEENQDKAAYTAKKLKKGESDLEEGRRELNDNKQMLEYIKEQLAQLEQAGLDKDPAYAEQYNRLQQNKELLEAGIPLGESQLNAGEQSLKEGITQVSRELMEAGVTNIDNLQSADNAADLMKTSATIALNVARAGVLIQKQGLALQVQNAYYEVLEKERLVKVQEDSLQLADKLYRFAKDSFEAGFSAKDEVLLATLQLKAAKTKLLQAKHDLAAAKNQLKKLMNYPEREDFTLKDNFTTQEAVPDLEQGLNQGLTKRLEVLKAEGELAVAALNFDIVSRTYTPNTFYYREADLQRERALLNLDRQRAEVKYSILDSYNAVKTAQEALDTVRDMQQLAKENLEIATFKYQTGFGENSKLLQELKIENLSGTIAEVLAAQEKLSEVEAAVVKAIYNYNLALAKYRFDTAQY